MTKEKKLEKICTEFKEIVEEYDSKNKGPYFQYYESLPDGTKNNLNYGEGGEEFAENAVKKVYEAIELYSDKLKKASEKTVKKRNLRREFMKYFKETLQKIKEDPLHAGCSFGTVSYMITKVSEALNPADMQKIGEMMFHAVRILDLSPNSQGKFYYLDSILDKIPDKNFIDVEKFGEALAIHHRGNIGYENVDVIKKYGVKNKELIQRVQELGKLYDKKEKVIKEATEKYEKTLQSVHFMNKLNKYGGKKNDKTK